MLLLFRLQNKKSPSLLSKSAQLSCSKSQLVNMPSNYSIMRYYSITSSSLSLLFLLTFSSTIRVFFCQLDGSHRSSLSFEILSIFFGVPPKCIFSDAGPILFVNLEHRQISQSVSIRNLNIYYMPNQVSVQIQATRIFKRREAHQKFIKYFPIINCLQLQLNLKQMLNANTLTLPSLKRFDLFGLSASTIPSVKNSPYTCINSNASERKREKEFPTQAVATTAIRTRGCNNMYEQVLWFQQQNKWEALLKISTVFIIVLLSYYLELCQFETLLCLNVAAILFIGLQHGISQLKALKRWAELSLLGSTFVLANQIFISTLSLISAQRAELLYSKHLTLIPALLITSLMAVYYIYSPLILNPFQVCERNLKKSLVNYLPNLFEVMKRFLSLKYTLACAYFATSTVLYIGITFFQLEEILTNGGAYLQLVDPYVILAQALTLLWMIVVHHAFLQFLDQLVFWQIAIAVLYGEVNSYTKIPFILELLKVVPTEQAKKQLTQSGLLQLFKVFSVAQSRVENNLNQAKLENIYKHSLAFLISYLDRNNSLKNRIPIYSFNITSATEPKIYTTFQALFLQFSDQELARCLASICQLAQYIERVHILKNNRKKLYQDLFYYVKMEMRQFEVHSSILKCAKTLQICDYILEIILTNGIDGQTEIAAKVRKLEEITSKLGGVFWVNGALRARLESIGKKGRKILAKIEK